MKDRNGHLPSSRWGPAEARSQELYLRSPLWVAGVQAQEQSGCTLTASWNLEGSRGMNLGTLQWHASTPKHCLDHQAKTLARRGRGFRLGENSSEGRNQPFVHQAVCLPPAPFTDPACAPRGSEDFLSVGRHHEVGATGGFPQHTWAPVGLPTAQVRNSYSFETIHPQTFQLSECMLPASPNSIPLFCL